MLPLSITDSLIYLKIVSTSTPMLWNRHQHHSINSTAASTSILTHVLVHTNIHLSIHHFCINLRLHFACPIDPFANNDNDSDGRQKVCERSNECENQSNQYFVRTFKYIIHSQAKMRKHLLLAPVNVTYPLAQIWLCENLVMAFDWSCIAKLNLQFAYEKFLLQNLSFSFCCGWWTHQYGTY